MAVYPIKMLKDEQNNPFVPLTSTLAVRDENGQTVEQIVASKLSPSNIKQGENIIVSVSGNDVTITADVPDTTVLIDNLNQTTAGVGALDARQGNVLYNTLQEQRVPAGGTTGQVLKKHSSSDNDLEWGDAADPNAISGDGSIKKIIEITYEDYQELVNDDDVDPDTEYHIIESGSTGSIEYEIRRIIQEMDEVKHPIGSLEFNTSGTNPNTYLGFGTWELWGQGQVPVGVDTTQTEFNTVEKTGGAKTASTNYTPIGNNTGTAVTMNAVSLSHSGGAVGNHTLTTTEMPSHSHTVQGSTFTVSNNYGSGMSGIPCGASSWGNPAYGNAHWFTLNDNGGNGAHNHGFTQPDAHSFTPTTKTITNPTFTGTQATITESTLQPYITCYMWKRTA